VRKINPEIWLLLFLVVIAAGLHFLVASERMALVFYFLPTLFSAYHFGRRHATLTALASVAIVAVMLYLNPTLLISRVKLPFDSRWFDLTVWGGVLMIAGYATGTLYERNQSSLREMEDGYEGMLVILQNFLASQKYSDARAYRVATCAVRIAETVGLDAGSVEDIRTAALLLNTEQLGISTDVLCKAAQVTAEDLKRPTSAAGSAPSEASTIAGSLRRALPIFLSEKQLREGIAPIGEASFEVQILQLAHEYQSVISGQDGAKIPPTQAVKTVLESSKDRYDSMILDAFSKAFGGQAAAAGA
jgi:HD-GYP domain-containing protein (c-di-GMP phosphodiesterase class II)